MVCLYYLLLQDILFFPYVPVQGSIVILGLFIVFLCFCLPCCEPEAFLCLFELSTIILKYFLSNYSQTCIKRSPLGHIKGAYKTGDLLKEVQFI